MNNLTSTKFLIAILLTLVLTSVSFSQDSDKLTATEKQKISIFVADVYKQLRKTRDVSIFLNQPPANVFIDKSLKEIFDHEDLIKKDVVAKANPADLKQFWIQMNNLVYLGQVYSYSKYANPNSENIKNGFPKNVLIFLQKNSVISSCRAHSKNEDDADNCIIKNITELKKEIAVYKKISAMMRKYFVSHPPEKTALYQKNVLPYESEVKYFTIDECSANYAKDLCFVLPPNAKVISLLSNLPIGVILAEIDGKFKVLMFGGAD